MRRHRLGAEEEGGCIRLLHDASVWGGAQVRIKNHAQRLIFDSTQSRGQQWVILQHGVDPHQHAAMLGSQSVRLPPRPLTCDPFGVARACGDFAVQTHRALQRDKWSPRAMIVQKSAVQLLEARQQGLGPRVAPIEQIDLHACGL
jgi:hypothetical protein